MTLQRIGRRPFLLGAGAVAVTTARGLGESRAAQLVPNSTGTESPKLKVPALSCDSHHHIYDPARFPAVQPGAVPNARVAEYRLLQRRIGTTRNVIVTPRAYGTDNRVTLDAILQFGAHARGVAVVHPTVTDDELAQLRQGGIRGIRFSLAVNNTGTPAVSLDMIEPLSGRINELGWHVQIHAQAEQILAAGELWNRLPCTMVFDHLGSLPPSGGVKHPAFTLIRRLMDKGRTWVKLSGAYIGTTIGPTGTDYPAATEVAAAFVAAAPERLVWGSDWPHPTEAMKPDDAVLLDLLALWVPDEATRHRILVENPEILYGFSKSE